jgi:hypothetical protein
MPSIIYIIGCSNITEAWRYANDMQDSELLWITFRLIWISKQFAARIVRGDKWYERYWTIVSDFNLEGTCFPLLYPDQDKF